MKRPKGTVSATECAEHFGIGFKTLHGWRTRKDPAPHQKDPTHSRRVLYVLEEVQAWAVKHGLRAPGDPKPLTQGGGHPSDAAKSAGEEGPTVSSRAQEAATRKKEAEAELAELNLGEKRGELVSQSKVDQRIGQAIEACKSGLTAIPRKYCDHLYAASSATDMRKRLTEVVTEVLGVFSGTLSEEVA